MRDEKGRFLHGPDPVRHQFTRAERKRGYLAATFACDAHSWERAAWFYYRIRGYYRAVRRGEIPAAKKRRKK
jgi:hypothetical protein